MPELILYIGRPGSGKSTHYRKHFPSYTYVSQDEQGRARHRIQFEKAIDDKANIVVDRQNHIREQREYFLGTAKKNGYTTRIIEFKVHRSLCENRILNRENHPTVKSNANVRAILMSYEKQYQGVLPDEADKHETIKQSFYAPQQDLTHLTGRIMVIGDPHGTFIECKAAIDELKPDHVVFVGDLTDRGIGICELLEYVRENDNVYTLLGNHEQKFLRALKGNKVSTSGGLDSTLAQIEHYTEEQRLDLYNWIAGLPVIIRLPKNYAAVHAGVNPERPLNKQYYDVCLYIRNHGGHHMDDPSYPRWYDYEPHEDLTEHILFGHAIHEKANVSHWATALDMGAVYGTGLRAMIIDTNGEDTIHEWETPVYYKVKEKKTGAVAEREELVGKYLSKSEFDNLVLFNYNDKCTFDRAWDSVTLSSRGTIYNKESQQVVARSYSKFFNLNEHESTRIDKLPWDKPFQVFEKMDGSLGTHYRHKGEHRIATRGSFFSDQAKKATEMLKHYDLTYMDEKHKWNLIFEIIYPENRIAVDYGQREELVLLGGYKTHTGEELSWDKIEKIAKKCGFPLPKVYNYTLDQMLKLKDEIEWDKSEGWVVRFENGLRVKIKGTDYLRMAKIMSHMTPLAFWESMVAGEAEKYLEEIPEELREEAEEIYNALKKQLNKLKDECLSKAQELNLSEVNPEDRDQRKEIALSIQTCPKWMRGYLFQILVGKQTDATLLRLIRPTENIYVDLNEVMK